MKEKSHTHEITINWPYTVYTFLTGWRREELPQSLLATPQCCAGWLPVPLHLWHVWAWCPAAQPLLLYLGDPHWHQLSLGLHHAGGDLCRPLLLLPFLHDLEGKALVFVSHFMLSIFCPLSHSIFCIVLAVADGTESNSPSTTAKFSSPSLSPFDLWGSEK